jgi:hypothetical protein
MASSWRCINAAAPPADLRSWLHCPAPCAGLLAAAFDEGFEAFEIAPHAPGHHPYHVSDLFHQAFEFIIELQHHTGVIIGEAMEGDDPGIPRAG